MKLFEPIKIRSMVVPNRIVYPAIQLNMGMNGRRARAFYSERARGGTGLILTANTAIDNFSCEELWGGTAGLNDFIQRLRVFTNEVHTAGGKIGVQLWQANRFPQGKGVQAAGKEMYPDSGERIAPSATGDMRALTLPEIDAIIYRFAKGARNVREAGFDCVEIHGAHSYLLAQFSNPATNQRTDQFGGDLGAGDGELDGWGGLGEGAAGQKEYGGGGQDRPPGQVPHLRDTGKMPVPHWFYDWRIGA